MGFNVKKLVEFSVAAIEDFTKDHQDETFYAFAIDASMLCFNSEECAAATLKKYQDKWEQSTRHLNTMAEMTEEDHRNDDFSLELAEKYSGLDREDDQACLEIINSDRESQRKKGCDYRTAEEIGDLRANTGDWEYQGFAELQDEHGFDNDLYNDHYHEALETDEGHAPGTKYAQAMTALVTALMEANAFACLKKTPDFKVIWVDHD